jgi:hypothetical protein
MKKSLWKRTDDGIRHHVNPIVVIVELSNDTLEM